MTGDELYDLAPEDFTAARDALAKSVGGQAGKEIKALRKPTVAAWLVNQLVRRHGDEVTALLELGPALRTAQQRGDGEQLRALTGERRAATEVLVARARQIAADGGRALTPDAQMAVVACLDAAVADVAAAETLTAGRLSEPLSYSGLGPFGLAAVADLPDDGGPARRTAGSASERSTTQTAATKAAAAEARAAEVALARREKAAAELAEAEAERRAAEDRLRLAEQTLSDAKMGVDLARRRARDAKAVVDKLAR